MFIRRYQRQEPYIGRKEGHSKGKNGLDFDSSDVDLDLC
jgi:hypothetical protein